MMFLICFNKIIKVKLPTNEDNDLLFFWLQRFCPNISKIGEKKVDFEISCINKYNYNYKSYKNKIVLYGIWKNYESFLAKFITQVFQKLLINDDILILPAACVAQKNTAMLIIGDFWQGKTSTALELKSKFNFKLISDNYVAFKNGKIIGATSFISIRKENVNFHKASNKVLTINNREFYENPEKIIKPLSIKNFVIPFINEGDNNFHIVSKEESIWYLYQKFSRLLNGESVLFNGNLPSPIYNDKDISSKILKIIKKILKNKNILYASSSLLNISRESNKFFRR